MDPQQLNSYSYARNNPVILKDPQGEAVPIFILLALAVGAYWSRDEFVSIQNDFENEEIGKDTLVDYGKATAKVVVSAIGGEYQAVKWATRGVKVYENRERVGNFLNYAREELSKPPESKFLVQTTPRLPNGMNSVLQNSKKDSVYFGGISGNVPVDQLSRSVINYAQTPGADLTDPDFAGAIKSINEYNSPWLAPKK